MVEKKTQNTRGKRVSTGKSSTQSKETDSAGKGLNLEKIVHTYCDFVENAAPTLRKGADDLYEIWAKAANSSIEMQKSALKSFGVKTKYLDDVANMLNKTTEFVGEAQKTASSAAEETSLKVSKMLREKSKKS